MNLKEVLHSEISLMMMVLQLMALKLGDTLKAKGYLNLKMIGVGGLKQGVLRMILI